MEITKPDEQWNDLCVMSNGGWFWQTREWIDYTVLYKKGTDMSFMLKEGNQAMAACPLILEGNEFSFGGGYTWTPVLHPSLNLKASTTTLAFIFKHIDEMARVHKVVRSRFAIPPAAFCANNFLPTFGYIDASINTRVINLQTSLENIRRGMWKGHAADVTVGERLFDVQVFNFSNITEAIFDEYCKLHYKDAGRLTRDPQTFQMQLEWIKDNSAVLFGIHDGKEWIGFSYIFYYKYWAYYGSACSANMPGLPIGHALTWAAINWLRAHGFAYYELGWQRYESDFWEPASDKEIAISKFKRHFGGYNDPLWRGEKYYDQRFFVDTVMSRVNAFNNHFAAREESHA
ncbi:MAG: hypothetical protein PHU70_00530 [Dehalococcoidia bacterium]|nr:hypothetical protein [Dehalococcoidia bacterium]